MFETIAKGFIIGLLVSLPMGPINMLTIQRTLNRGRWHGFVTGLGAMLSDLLYALITMAGISVADDFITRYESIIQVVGSVILFLFGIGVYRSNPLRDWAPDKLPKETRYLKDFVSSFLLTFSNAAILLVLVGLYARFSFNPLADGPRFFVSGLGAFMGAAMLWWFVLTTLVDRLRRRFNREGLVFLNRTVGVILMLLGIGGVIFSLFPDLL